MSSQVELSARSGQATTVCVERSVRGRWKVVGPGRARPITCETLQDAERVAHLSLARTRARELIVRDAYHRVLHHELTGATPAAPLNSSSPAPAATQSPKSGGQ